MSLIHHKTHKTNFIESKNFNYNQKYKFPTSQTHPINITIPQFHIHQVLDQYTKNEITSTYKYNFLLA